MQNLLTRILTVGGLLAMSANLFAQIETPKSITFQEQEYKITKKKNNTQKDFTVTEYLPPNEKLKNFNQLFAVWEKPQSTDLKALVAQIALEGSINGTEHRISSMVYDQETNEYIIAKFLLSEKISEYNVYRLFLHDGHLAAYAYTKRTSFTPTKNSDDFNKWISDIKNNERGLLSTMLKFKLPS